SGELDRITLFKFISHRRDHGHTRIHQAANQDLFRLTGSIGTDAEVQYFHAGTPDSIQGALVHHFVDVEVPVFGIRRVGENLPKVKITTADSAQPDFVVYIGSNDARHMSSMTYYVLAARARVMVSRHHVFQIAMRQVDPRIEHRNFDCAGVG